MKGSLIMKHSLCCRLIVFGYFALTMTSSTARAAEPPMFEQTVVWKAGEADLITYHAPGLMVSRAGTVFVWADGRYDNPDDFGPHHMVLKRSDDGGRTFGANQYLGLSDNGEIFLFGNMIQPRERDRLHFLYSQKDPDDIHHHVFIWHRHSDDDGRTWSPPRRIEQPLFKADAELAQRIKRGTAGDQFRDEDPQLYTRRQFYTGPGMAIQLTEDHPVAPGRIVVPLLAIKNRVAQPEQRGTGPAVMFSDDHGKTWQAGGVVPIANCYASESSIVELPDGTLLLNSRNDAKNANDASEKRWISRSDDGGMTWSRAVPDTSGIPPFFRTHAGMIRLTPRSDGVDRILFSFPNGDVREKMTVMMSNDAHQSWPVRKVVHPGPSYYSNMAEHDGMVYLIYGRDGGHKWRPRDTVLARFNLALLVQPAKF